MHGEVIEKIELTPTMVRVVLGGDGLEGFEPSPHADQYVNALFVPDGAPYEVPFDVEAAHAGPPEHRPRGRRYTIRWWDPDTRTMAIDFVAHGDVGYAGRWAAHAQPGDRLVHLPRVAGSIRSGAVDQVAANLAHDFVYLIGRQRTQRSA